MARDDSAGTSHHPVAAGLKADLKSGGHRTRRTGFLGTAPPIWQANAIYAVGNGLLALDSDTGARQFGYRGPYQSSLGLTPRRLTREAANRR